MWRFRFSGRKAAEHRYDGFTVTSKGRARHKQSAVAERLGVSPRILKHSLRDQRSSPESKPQPSKFGPLFLHFESILEEDPFTNLVFGPADEQHPFFALNSPYRIGQ